MGLDSPEDLRGEGASTGCRSQLYSAVGITFDQKVRNADSIRTQQLEHNAVRTKKFPRYYTGSTAYMATYHQQKTFPFGRNGSVRVDALRQSRQRHPGGRLLRARC